MAKQKGSNKNKQANNSPRIVNRKARFDYHITEKLECGVKLRGSEVKSIRNGQVNLAEGFARIEPGDGQLYLYEIDIALYAHASAVSQHTPRRVRKLLVHKRQLAKLAEITQQKGVSLVPLTLYFVRGKVKIEIGVGTGKKSHDKRQDIKTKDANRQIKRAMTRKVL